MTETQRKKVAIVGKAPASIPRTPFGDAEYEIWSLSDNYRQLPRWDRWFEMHDLDWHRENHPEHWRFLTTDHGKPLYILHAHPEVPHATVYPLQQMMREFGGYWTNSISYMIALAIVEGFGHIGIYGVDMAQHDEYANQRPSCEWMIGMAQGRGITVYVPEESDLMKCRGLYGYQTHSGEMYRKLRARQNELTERINQARQQKADAERQCQVYFGALKELEQFGQFNGEVGSHVAQRKMDLSSRLQQCTSIREECEKREFVLSGALEDTHWTRQWCDITKG